MTTRYTYTGFSVLALDLGAEDAVVATIELVGSDDLGLVYTPTRNIQNVANATTGGLSRIAGDLYSSRLDGSAFSFNDPRLSVSFLDITHSGGTSQVLFAAYADFTDISASRVYMFVLSGPEINGGVLPLAGQLEGFASALSDISSGPFVPGSFFAASEPSSVVTIPLITGSGSADHLEGLSLGEEIDGFGGDDTIDGGDGNDSIDGGTGDDGVFGGAGNDQLDGGDGNDNMAGSTGNDVVNGGAGNDNMGGGQGNDVMDGGTGNDTMGAGFGNDSMDGGDGDDGVFGGAGNDIVNGGAGNDDMAGSFGSDALNGGLGNDDIGGGTGKDTITGGAGNDRINAGVGDDNITGGAGNDTFIFTEFTSGETDTITDWTNGEDVFRLTASAIDNAPGSGLQGNLDALNGTQVGNDVHATYDGHTIVLLGASLDDIGLEDFIFV